jgi:hypothetical protein
MFVVGQSTVIIPGFVGPKIGGVIFHTRLFLIYITLDFRENGFFYMFQTYM